MLVDLFLASDRWGMRTSGLYTHVIIDARNRGLNERTNGQTQTEEKDEKERERKLIKILPREREGGGGVCYN